MNDQTSFSFNGICRKASSHGVVSPFRRVFLAACLMIGTHPAMAQTAPEQAGHAANKTPLDPALADIRDITVVGDAEVIAAPDGAEITMQFTQKSSDATGDQSAVDIITKNLTAQLQGASNNPSVQVKNDRWYQGNSRSSQLLAGQPPALERTFLVRVRGLENVGKTIDSALKVTGISIVEVKPVVFDSSRAKSEAHSLAASAAEQKAHATAKALGVSLGLPLTVQTSEEPDGSALRDRLGQGEGLATFSDERIRVYVTVRYAISNK